MFEWIKKYKYIFFIVLFFLIIGIPTIIHFLFKIDTKLYWLQAVWDAGDLLQYYATILSFLSSLFLGIVALQFTILSRDDQLKREYGINAEIDKTEIVNIIKNSNNYIIRIILKYHDSINPSYAYLLDFQFDYWGYIFKEGKNWCSIEVLGDNKLRLEFIFTGDRYNLIESRERKEITLLEEYLYGPIRLEDFIVSRNININATLGIECNEIVTPLFFDLDIKPNEDNFINSDNSHNYLITNSYLRIDRPVKLTDFKKEHRYEIENTSISFKDLDID